MRLGFVEEAGAFATFMQQRAKERAEMNGPLNVMYRIDGRHDLPEETLDHLEGYCGSRPIRVGNAAADHLQLDIYGELMDSLYLYDKYATPTSYDMWSAIRRLTDWVADNWQLPDRSIWEVRGPEQHFTYSKLQCWVALDRAIRLAQKRSLPAHDRWRGERDRIYEAIMTKAWNEERQAFTQYFGSDAIDAGSLLMPLMLFIAPTDPRNKATLEAIRSDLVHDALVKRYLQGEAARDGLPGGEGTFSVCSFWYAEALARSGAVEEGQTIFDKMLTFMNPLGLLSEEIGETGQALGNFPQALTHLGLISAAFNVDRALDTPQRF
jgi:GH15 family glucan-1,4-alpha-glucosidase